MKLAEFDLYSKGTKIYIKHDTLAYIKATITDKKISEETFLLMALGEDGNQYTVSKDMKGITDSDLPLLVNDEEFYVMFYLMKGKNKEFN